MELEPYAQAADEKQYGEMLDALSHRKRSDIAWIWISAFVSRDRKHAGLHDVDKRIQYLHQEGGEKDAAQDDAELIIDQVPHRQPKLEDLRGPRHLLGRVNAENSQRLR